MEPGMKAYGMASASEFLGDRIVYRNLVPLDPDLPGLPECASNLGLPAGRIPRKHELDYARVVVELLRAAQAAAGSKVPLQHLVFIGDTELLDGTAFNNLCKVTGWKGLAFIGDETGEPASSRLLDTPNGSIFLANRWYSLEEFDEHCRRSGQPVQEGTAAVIDLDKTILGARRRNSKMIDWSRSKAMELTIADLLGERFDAVAFQEVYRTFNHVEFHPFTSDNQDYLAYVCLMLLAQVVDPDRLASAVRQGGLTEFEQFISEMDTSRDQLPVSIKEIHREVYACVQAGDPTPFKTFRRKEYAITVSAMGCLEAQAPVEALLEREITLTQEVRRMAVEWQRRGALLFGLSDKPDEASVPMEEMASQGYQPLHRTLTHAVGA